jgi:hypothetical protein
MMHSVNTLPKWARLLIIAQQTEIRELKEQVSHLSTELSCAYSAQGGMT